MDDYVLYKFFKKGEVQLYTYILVYIMKFGIKIVFFFLGNVKISDLILIGIDIVMQYDVIMDLFKYDYMIVENEVVRVVREVVKVLKRLRLCCNNVIIGFFIWIGQLGIKKQVFCEFRCVKE